MMGSSNFERGLIATATVLHPVAYAGDSAAAEFGLFDNLGILFALFKHFGRLEARANLYDLFLCHNIA